MTQSTSRAVATAGTLGPGRGGLVATLRTALLGWLDVPRGDAAAGARWPAVFHPPGVVRLVTPAERHPDDERVRRSSSDTDTTAHRARRDT